MKLGKSSKHNEKLYQRVSRILDKAITHQSKLGELMIQDAENETLEEKVNQLSLLRQGINRW